MKVILQQDVKNLGKKGDLVEVAEGYGRNFIIPRKLGVEATDGNVRKLENEKGAEKARKQRELKEAQQMASHIDGKTLKLQAKVGDAGKLFGSVTTSDIAERLKKQYKVEIDKRKIDLKEPIKNLGTFDVTVKVHPKVKATVKVQVVEA